MNTYRLLRPVYRPVDPVFYSLKFELIRMIQATSAEEALAEAKRLGYFSPVIEPAKVALQ